MTDDERVFRLLADVLAGREPGRPLTELLGRRAMDDLRMDGVAVTVLSTPEHRHVVFASDDDVVAAQDVQFTLGDGPVIDAYRDGRPVLVPDLPREAVDRWPLFGKVSARTPAYAGVFAFPLVVDADAGPVGVLALYRRQPTTVDPATVTEALALARAMALAVVRHPPDPADPAGVDALERLAGVDDPETAVVLRDPLGYEGELLRWSGAEQAVYQAVGMVVARLRLQPFEALARLRAHAFASEATLDEVAMAVVERRLRLED